MMLDHIAKSAIAVKIAAVKVAVWLF